MGRFHWNNYSRTLHIWLNWYWLPDYVRDSTETTLYWRWVGAIIWAISASIPSLASTSVGRLSSQLGLTILWDRSMTSGPQKGTGSKLIQSWNEQELLQIWLILQPCLQIQWKACFERSSPNKFSEIVWDLWDLTRVSSRCHTKLSLFILGTKIRLVLFAYWIV